MLAGFEQPTEGRVFIDGQDMTGVPPYERPVNMMFQSYALFPHMSVEKNVGYGLKHEKMTDAQRKDRVKADARSGAADAACRSASRINCRAASASAWRSPARLPSSPSSCFSTSRLGALDKKLREQTQFEIMNIQEKTGITFVVVTHDQEEAMTLATRIAVMDQGEIRQTGTPTEIYEFPAARASSPISSARSISSRAPSITRANGKAVVACDDWGARSHRCDRDDGACRRQQGVGCGPAGKDRD